MLMQPSFDLLNFTCDDFALTLAQRLGKGKIQAAALYKEWYSHGTLEGKDPCFGNARTLQSQITALVELPSLQPQQIKREEATIKFTLALHDGYETESVIIPMKAGFTLCLSSQVGCRMGCRFCETGRLGLIRQLSCSEILRQVACARHYFGADIRNVVFMGMGEPMDNLLAVSRAIAIMSDPKAFNIGRRHITVSTSGHLEGLTQFTQLVQPPVNLAVSVIASNDATRTRLMPVNRRWNMAQLYEAMKLYSQSTKRQVLVEYVLIGGVNDSIEDAQELASYLQGLDVKVNLIPYNAQSTAIAGSMTWRTSDQGEIFAQQLHQRGLRTMLRQRKGHDIMAACGQLGNLRWRKSRLAVID